MAKTIANEAEKVMISRYNNFGDISSNIKSKWRLINQCLKVVKDLSALPDSVLDLEHVYPSIAETRSNDSFIMHFNREKFENLCNDLKNKMENMLFDATKQMISLDNNQEKKKKTKAKVVLLELRLLVVVQEFHGFNN